jgi:AcrR family transcriptional regulator
MPTAAATPTAASVSAPHVDPGLDGRRRRGQASRRAILDAAAAVITEAGVHALTHRAVAAAADLPPARVAYHFPTVEDLMGAAAHRYLADFDDHLRSMAAEAVAGERSIVEVCTDVLHELVTDGAAEFLGMVEVRLALARRGATVEDTGIVPLVASFGVDRHHAESIAAAMFGFAVLAAADPAPVPRARVRDHVRTVLEGAG